MEMIFGNHCERAECRIPSFFVSRARYCLFEVKDQGVGVYLGCTGNSVWRCCWRQQSTPQRKHRFLQLWKSHYSPLKHSQLFSASRNHGQPSVRLVGTGGDRDGRSTQPIRLSDSPRTIWRPSPRRGRRELARSIRFGNRPPSSSGCQSACRSWLSLENEVQLPPRLPLRSDPRHGVARVWKNLVRLGEGTFPE